MKLFKRLLDLLNIHPDKNQRWTLSTLFIVGLLDAYVGPAISKAWVTLLPGEFRIKGTCSNGCMCQPDVIYVARWLTKADGRGNDGRLRIWAHGSWVEDNKRYGSYCDWEKSILQNYEVLPDQMSREAYEKWKREYLAYPKPKED